MSDIPQKYDFTIEEKKTQQFWETENIFTFNEKTDKPVYSIDTPPPTVSGKMHIGHACSFTQQDIVARYKRMKGFEVFYPFGTDDNGLATEKLVQKQKKLSLRHVPREEAIKTVLEFLDEERPLFIQDWKDIGMSCDFDILYSTIDNNSRKVAQKTFLDLVKEGRAYQKEAPVIWDTQFQSAIAQAELENIEKKTFFNDIVFKTEQGDDMIIATTRPELLAACVAVFAHPDDKRYQHLFGKYALSPLYNAKVPILPDEKADPEKGTGLVMCCTFGDQTDIEWYKKHNLPLKMVITPDGKMNEHSGKYSGMRIEDARKEIIQDLKDAKLLVNQKEIVHAVNVGERSGRPVEIINSKQWYIKYLDQREHFLQSAEKLNWTPAHMKHRVDNWIKGLNWDWSISRQRHYGIPIPAWYDEQGNVYYADETQLPVDPTKDRPLSAPEGIELIAETDVFDTWFTSASTPFLATEKFKDKPIYKDLFPMNLRPQAHDIINFWLFYTMAKTQLLHKVNPWEDVIISGFVLDPKGNKMSKSKGNTISPQEMTAKYSADALRYWASGSKLGDDTPFMEKELVTGKKLVTKMWNAAKFVSMHLEDFGGKQPEKLEVLDKWMIAKTNSVVKKATEAFEKYEYSKAKFEIDQFFWTTLCDNYLELVKDRLYKPEIYGEEARKSGQFTAKYVFSTVNKLLAPIVPHITETLYQLFFQEDAKSVHTSNWPTQLDIEADAEYIRKTQPIVDFIAAVRRQKAQDGVSLKTEIESVVANVSEESKALFEQAIADVKGTIKAETVTIEVREDSDAFENLVYKQEEEE